MNNGKYDGGQILKPKTVTELFKNQLPGHVNLKLDAVKGHPWVTDSGDFPDTCDKFSFAFGIEANPNEKVRPQGTAYWAGLANSYYSLDKTNGVAIVYFTQFLPFNDKETYDFYRLYEKEVYAEIEK
jgi:methyl acetate hydrolase